jgi:hypothetical protein
MPEHGYKQQKDQIKDELKNFFKGHQELDKAVDSVFDVIDGSIGMVYKLDDKKTTAKFAEIIRKYFHDHKQQAPDGLMFFIELGLEVIADLIEKKDPPAWYEVLAVTVMGVIQIVAGAIIKAYLPVVGELIGNALISSGMDDVVFAISSAIKGEFSWEDYGTHKVASLKRSLISSAISCGISFGLSAVQGGVGEAWKVQQLTGAEKAVQAAGNVSTGFNLGTYVLKEAGRSFISMGISQIASRGLEGMTKIIAGSYQDKVRSGIEKAVNDHWHLIQAQAKALYEHLNHDDSFKELFQACIKLALDKIQEENGFDSAVRGSKQVLPQASSLIGDSGWASFVSAAPDIANLGVSIPKLINLVEDNVHQLARTVRETKERKAAIVAPQHQIGEQAYNQELEKRKGEYTTQLIDAFNGVLNGAVYAPLVSMGTQALMKAGQEALLPKSRQEDLAENKKFLSEMLAAESNPDATFSDVDALYRKWNKAQDEVSNLNEDELLRKPINADVDIATLKRQYGPHLKVYKDQEGNFFAQRPTRREYIEGIKDGKASSDPEILMLAQIVKKEIAIRTPEGKIKVYSQSGKISNLDPSDAQGDKFIQLKLLSSKEDGVGHVAVDKLLDPTTASPYSYDCLYDAVQKAAGRTENIQELRDKVAAQLDLPENKRLFHEWSVSSDTKTFVGQEIGQQPYRSGFQQFVDWHVAFYEGYKKGYDESFSLLKSRFQNPLAYPEDYPFEPGPLSIYSTANARALGEGVGLAAQGAKMFFALAERFTKAPVFNIKKPGPTVDPTTGKRVGKFYADDKGNVMISPQGGGMRPHYNKAGVKTESTHTLYPNGSVYHRLDPKGHGPKGVPHGHGHLKGTGPGIKGQGPSLDRTGQVVNPKSGPAHWGVKQ